MGMCAQGKNMAQGALYRFALLAAQQAAQEAAAQHRPLPDNTAALARVQQVVAAQVNKGRRHRGRFM
jgi:hypothetical protein